MCYAQSVDWDSLRIVLRKLQIRTLCNNPWIAHVSQSLGCIKNNLQSMDNKKKQSKVNLAENRSTQPTVIDHAVFLYIAQMSTHSVEDHAT